ncbi:MAG: hypothetical protein NTW33_02300 [Methanoregula sp.]|nr:hypothetical protein [Methanoregula sp.]
MKICIVLPEMNESVLHFINCANAAQAFFKFESVELHSTEEEEILSIRDITADDMPSLMEKLYSLKISLGYKDEDLLMTFFGGRIIDDAGGDSFFSWGTTLLEPNPAVAIISLDYLYPNRHVLDNNDSSYVGRSIQYNMFAPLVWTYTDLECHYKTVSCIMDFCSDTHQINIGLKKGFYFCSTNDCQQRMEKTEAGRAILSIANYLNTFPYRAYSQMPMIPICFKTGQIKCPNSPLINPRQVFVGMPFSDDYIDIYTHAIKPALITLGYIPWRGDDHPVLIDMMCKLCQAIQESEYAIIDLSGMNPNVMLELGMCLGLGRRVLLIKRRGTDVPVDLRGMEYLEYTSATNLNKPLSVRLQQVFL